MNVGFIASEMVPFSKTGGLADVTGALPAALASEGCALRAVVPHYRETRQAVADARVGEPWALTHDRHTYQVRIHAARLPGTEIPVDLIDIPELFDRDGLYGVNGTDHADNATRFAVFCRAALRHLERLGWIPDILHCHDWQSGLVPTYLQHDAASRAAFATTRTVFTIHNLAYQGLFPVHQWPATELPHSEYRMERLEYYGKFSYLKAGLLDATYLTTVSPTYAREIQTSEAGCGMDGLLRQRHDRLAGILNGIDTTVWNPGTDPLIPQTYSLQDLRGKAACKAALQRQSNLRHEPALLIGMISRLVEQKGFDLLEQMLERLMALPVQLVILGTGEPRYHQMLEDAQRQFPGRLAVRLRFDNRLAHTIEAGADAFFMPSRYEPCGLNQLYSLRYGTVPIVRRTGGLADTVVDATPTTLARRTASGFVFEPYDVESCLQAIARAVAAHRATTPWRQLVESGMRQDFSWARSAHEYHDLYRRVQELPR